MPSYGVYRGVIINSADPIAKGRVQVRVPDMMMGNAWAVVCTAFGAPTSTTTSIGSAVLVAFEGGYAQRPVVLGSIQT
jgi:hypothetical protein